MNNFAQIIISSFLKVNFPLKDCIVLLFLSKEYFKILNGCRVLTHHIHTQLKHFELIAFEGAHHFVYFIKQQIFIRRICIISFRIMKFTIRYFGRKHEVHINRSYLDLGRGGGSVIISQLGHEALVCIPGVVTHVVVVDNFTLLVEELQGLLCVLSNFGHTINILGIGLFLSNKGFLLKLVVERIWELLGNFLPRKAGRVFSFLIWTILRKMSRHLTIVASAYLLLLEFPFEIPFGESLHKEMHVLI